MPIAKTSRSYPLRVDNVAIEGLSGVIGMTFCPGKKQRGALSGDWDRDLLTDLEVISSSGAGALVTLMESEELSDMQVPLTELGEKAANLGLEWHHLPIRDVGVPDGQFEDLWSYSGLRLRGLLVRGKKVVIHCLGGLGRTGTIAARLLVEFGASLDGAIRAVRAARTGAIEIRKQEEYVKNCKPVSAREPRSRDEKTLAVLLGSAIGDAFGYEVEFDSIRSIKTRFGSAGITEPTFHDRKLVVSDDTQMTLFTLEGLVRALAGGRLSSNCAQSRFEWRTSTGWERSGKARSPRGGSPPSSRCTPGARQEILA